MARERIDVRIEPDILEELEIAAGREGISSRSAAVREAVFFYLDAKKNSWNTDNVSVKIPRRLTDKAELFVRNGDAEDLRQAIILALDCWCRDLDAYHRRGGREELEAVVAQNAGSDAARDEMRARAGKLSKR